ncbi:MAG TPA: hypothetical protein VMR74_12665 [Gammaproteobacteria bacterium]|nr:hypothetical protein [Gammaproteobacteria bacterium]
MNVLSPEELSLIARYRRSTRIASPIHDRLHEAGLRWCRGCAEVRSVECFSPSKSSKHGLFTRCRRCVRKSQAGKLRVAAPYVPATDAEVREFARVSGLLVYYRNYDYQKRRRRLQDAKRRRKNRTQH